MKRRVAAAVVCASALATSAAIATPETFWTADGQDLANSLERAGDGIAAPDPCKQVVGERWTCGIEDDPGSGWSADYRVTLKPDGCWRAVRAWYSLPPGLGPPDADELQERARRGPEPLAACLNAIDYVRP